MILVSSAALITFHARGWAKLLAFVALVVASAISFETVFNGFERFAHVTTAPVAAARLRQAAIEAEIGGLSETTLDTEKRSRPGDPHPRGAPQGAARST